MNKAQARDFARRLIDGYIERMYCMGKDPICYDIMFPKEVRGRRLSASDQERVDDAMIDERRRLMANFDRWVQGGGRLRRGYSRPDGKPGARWKGWEAFCKLMGWG